MSKELTINFNAEITLQIIYADSERSLVPQLYSKISEYECAATKEFEKKYKKKGVSKDPDEFCQNI